MANTFKIGISPKILDKARNFFNSTTEDVVNELLQNSRRAGATKVKVTKTADTVTIEDNGIGIFSNGVSINLGGSEWSSETQEREDPAGCGLFSLANFDSIIESHGKKVRLNAEAFNGTQEVDIEESNFSEGTRITFTNTDEEWLFKSKLEKACKFYPLQVEYNHVKLDSSRDFLENAVYIKEWEGLRIGVVRKEYDSISEVFISCSDFKLNFYGLEIKCLERQRPYFYRALANTDLLVKVDILDCPKLQLVLPSRKEVVSNNFLQLLFLQCRKVVFSYIKNHCDNGGSHKLSYKLWLEAKESFGIELPEAEQQLLKWYPETDSYHNAFYDEPVDVVPTSTVVYSLEQENYEQHTLYHALENNPEQITLVHKNTNYEGYQWYNQLPKLKEVKTTLTYEGKTFLLQELLEQEECSTRPDSVELELLIEDSSLDTRAITLATDLVLAGELWVYGIDEAIIFLTKKTQIKLEDLVQVLTWCFFNPSDDHEADSYDTQAEYFSAEVWSVARSLLLSQEEAVIARIQEAVQAISWLVPSESIAVIKVNKGLVTVELKPTEQCSNEV